MTAQPTWLHPDHDPLAEHLSLDPVEQAIRDIAAGRPVVVVDDEDRENEGDLVIAAEKATPEIVAFMMSECRGLICAPMESDELERLELPQMVEDNTESMQTAFTVSVDASAAHGVTTGISAADRATTLRMLAGGVAGPGDFVRPGHIFPLRARSGGVLVRNGHTEAAVDLARLAGLRPAGAIVEIAGEDGVMLRLPELIPFARKHGLTIISIEDLIAYRRSNEPTVRREAQTRLPTAFGDFTAYGYRSIADGVEHVALVHGDIGDGEDVLVRIHSECLTGDIFQSQRCDCGPSCTPPCGASPKPAGASSSTSAATRDAASACSPSSARTNSRSAASTPSTPTWSSACPPTPATTRRAPGSSRTSASPACG